MCININSYILGFKGGRLYVFGGINRGGCCDVNEPIYYIKISYFLLIFYNSFEQKVYKLFDSRTINCPISIYTMTNFYFL